METGKVLEKMKVLDVYYDEEEKGYVFVFNDRFRSSMDGKEYYNYVCITKNGWYHGYCSYNKRGKNTHLGKKVNPQEISEDVKKIMMKYYNTFYEREGKGETEEIKNDRF